jgi:hypothetical protein
MTKALLALSMAGLLAACSSYNRTPFSYLLETARNNCNAGDQSACQDLGELAQEDAQFRANRQRRFHEDMARFDEGMDQAREAIANGVAIINASRPVPPRVVFEQPDPPSGPKNCSGTVGTFGNFTATCW